MRIIMTLCVRNEEDVLDAQLAFHLNVGVDFVIVTDTGSTDGTLEILERYAQAGVLQLHHHHSVPFDQAELVTQMARRAAKELEADWVINADADEFWWPRGQNLTDVLGSVPARYGVVRGIWRAFVPRPDDERPFYERMVIRLAPQAALNEPERPFRPHSKVAHRSDPGVRVTTGNHDLTETILVPLRGWYPIEVLHFPMRTAEQVARKHQANSDAWGRRGMYARTAGEALAPHLLSESEIQRGLEEGVLVADTRLCDALRTLHNPVSGQFDPPSEGVSHLRLQQPTIVDDALYAVDAAVLADADEVRLRRGLDELDRRQKELERLALVRLEQRLRGFLVRKRR